MSCNRFQEIDLAEFAVDPRAAAWAEFRVHYPHCAECSRAVARIATIKRALATERAGASAHPFDPQLLALATHPEQLAPDERARLEAHVAGCAPCRTELGVARGFDFAAVSEEAPRRASWLAGLGAAVFLPLRRPAFAAALAVVLAVAVAVLISRRTDETGAPGSPTADTEIRTPVSNIAKAPPEAPAPAAIPREEPAVAKTPPPPELAAPAAPPEQTAIAKVTPAAKPPPIVEPSPEREAPKPESAAPPAPLLIAALLPSESPRYVPGALASGSSVRTGGGARSAGAGAPAPEALAPEHVGATSHESPNLYWFLPEATSSPVEVTVVAPGVAAPLLEKTLSGPFEAGVHRVSLAEHGARLAPGVEYRWFVAVVRDPARRSQDLVSGAAIRFTPAPELLARLASAPPASAAHVYAESGLWYDAFDQLASWLAAEPDTALLHSHLAALLEQVGQADAAAFERRGAPGGR